MSLCGKTVTAESGGTGGCPGNTSCVAINKRMAVDDSTDFLVDTVALAPVNKNLITGGTSDMELTMQAGTWVFEFCGNMYQKKGGSVKYDIEFGITLDGTLIPSTYRKISIALDDWRIPVHTLSIPVVVTVGQVVQAVVGCIYDGNPTDAINIAHRQLTATRMV